MKFPGPTRQESPWCSTGMDGSLPPDSFPVRRMLVTAVMGQNRPLTRWSGRRESALAASANMVISHLELGFCRTADGAMLMIKRREFIAGLGITIAWPVAARAQKTVPVIGYLSSRSLESNVSMLIAFRRGLNDTGYVEGRT